VIISFIIDREKVIPRRCGGFYDESFDLMNLILSARMYKILNAHFLVGRTMGEFENLRSDL